VTDQIEYHALLSHDDVLDKARSRGMSVTAYSPLAQGSVFGNEPLKEIARRHEKSAGQVALRWLYQQEDVVSIPRSSDPGHARDNFDIHGFELSDDEMDSIFDLSSIRKRQVNPTDLAPDWD